MSYSNLLFRAREKGVYGVNDFFHIPFNKRDLVSNNRFSISGQPMLYLGYSILTLEKELNIQIDNLSIAAFLPKYSTYYPLKINEIGNEIFSEMVNSLLAIFNAGSKVEFHYESHIKK